ncbi:MAG: hypothetical protein R2762_15470 [Bryobacteraceae bacterium]
MSRARWIGIVTALGALAAVLMPSPPAARDGVPAKQGQVERRVVLGLYDGSYTQGPEDIALRRMAEMPLNHLGLILRTHDVRTGLPPVETLRDVRGLLCWFAADRMNDPVKFVDWLERASAGRKLVWMGQAAFNRDSANKLTPGALRARAWKLMGLENLGQWSAVTYDAKVTFADPALIGFERKLDGVIPPFGIYRKIDPAVQAHLVVRRGDRPGGESVLVVTSPRGGFVAPDFTHHLGQGHDLQWYVNPFEFFRRALFDAPMPAPDTTTVSGRRIYYSHIDGDGWRNRTEVMPYRKDGLLAAEVVWRELIEPYPDLPVTVAPIAGDLDPEWRGSRETLSLARRMLAEPHVEAGTHTYTHPLQWQYFENYDRMREPTGPQTPTGETKDAARAYTDRPFDIEHEIAGSIRFIEGLLPPEKKVRLVQWSGNTRAFEAAIAATRRAGVPNLNGGDSRYDAEYPSLIWVAPLGRRVGSQLQIYSSNSNENTYTDLWTTRFFGYRLVLTTIERTEHPRRLKPFNLYYHMYTGEKHAAMHALKFCLDTARKSELAPVAASHFASIADGFFSTRLVRLDGSGPGVETWRIENRGALNTIRFDQPGGRSVDLARSRGVLGERTFQGSLYVALDAAEKEPVVTLSSGAAAPEAALIQARWRIWNLRREKDGIRFTAQGYGQGEMKWRLPQRGEMRILVDGAPAARAVVSPGGTLAATIAASALEPVEIEIRGGSI